MPERCTPACRATGMPYMETDKLHNRGTPNGSHRTGRRLRVLTCACTSQEANEVLSSFNELETMHIPSNDVPELEEELSRLHPDYVLCKAEFLLALMPANGADPEHHFSRAPRPQQSQSVAAVLLKSSDISPRDVEVLQLLAKGARNTDIAIALGLAESSVKRILQRLYERFEAANRAELLGRVMELRLLTDPILEPKQMQLP